MGFEYGIRVWDSSAIHGATESSYSLKPRPSSPRFYLIFLQGYEIKSGRGRPGFEARIVTHQER